MVTKVKDVLRSRSILYQIVNVWNSTFGYTALLSTNWVHYVEEPLKHQVFMQHSFSVGGWFAGSWGRWVGMVVLLWWGSGGMGDGVGGVLVRDGGGEMGGIGVVVCWVVVVGVVVCWMGGVLVRDGCGGVLGGWWCEWCAVEGLEQWGWQCGEWWVS